jgi:hypothetical protein
MCIVNTVPGVDLLSVFGVNLLMLSYKLPYFISATKFVTVLRQVLAYKNSVGVCLIRAIQLLKCIRACSIELLRQ